MKKTKEECLLMNGIMSFDLGKNEARIMKAMDDWAEDVVKNNLVKPDVMLSLPNDRKKHMRKQATTIFELTKGFTGESTDNAMKAALEMAGYVQELTTDVE